MRYLSDKLVTKKYIDDFIEQSLIEIDIINDNTPKNINPNFHVVAEMGSYKRKYTLERSEFGVPWVRVLDNYSSKLGYPTCIAVQVYKNSMYEVTNWIDTDRDIVVKLQNHDGNFIAEKQVFASNKPQRVTLNFTHTTNTRASNFRIFFDGDFKGIRFTKYAIERKV